MDKQKFLLSECVVIENSWLYSYFRNKYACHDLTHVKALAIGIAKAVYRNILILFLSFTWIGMHNPGEVSTAV